VNREIAGSTIDVNDEGYLTDFSQWTREIGGELAREAGIEMTDKHWEVIDFIQQSFRDGTPLSIRSIGKRGPVSIKEFYELFPEGPLKKSSKIAGIPKPASCI
jgi:tRNA 2-thiouridine synthesizing protein E